MIDNNRSNMPTYLLEQLLEYNLSNLCLLRRCNDAVSPILKLR